MIPRGQLQSKIEHIITDSDSKDIKLESKRALAFAYANLLMEDPRMVTIGHLQILRNKLLPEQVCFLTKYVVSHSKEECGSFLYTFEQVFGECKSFPFPSNSAA